MKKLLVITILMVALSGCLSIKPTRNRTKERTKKMMISYPQYAIVNNNFKNILTLNEIFFSFNRI